MKKAQGNYKLETAVEHALDEALAKVVGQTSASVPEILDVVSARIFELQRMLSKEPVN